jgi:cytoskeleton protein RodZ
MALFGHKRRARREPEDIEPPAPEPRAPETVGALLRRARLRQDGDIEHIAALLRLRPAYIVAIEEGRYGELPGAAYALGFVRAYAEHLGLDGHEIVRRFKAEAAGLERRQDLALPMPLPERSRPGGGLLLIALIVAGCAYALWWYFASGERTRPERVAAPPEEIAPSPVPPPVAEAPMQDEQTPDFGAPPAATSTTPPTDLSAAPSASTAPPSPIVTLPGAAPPQATPAGPPPPSSGGMTAPPSAAPSPTAPAPTPPSTPPTSTVAAPPPPPPPETGAAPEGPRVYGVTNGPARIVIRATADSWIQIRDRDGSQARILKPGEVYRVPDRPGLTMRVGNAGGVEILVDGKPTPALGQAGQTRNVALDPARLLAGNAILQ